jgi:hypothetical protein
MLEIKHMKNLIIILALYLIVIEVSASSGFPMAETASAVRITAPEIEWDQNKYSEFSKSRSGVPSILQLPSLTNGTPHLPLVIQKGDRSIWLFESISMKEFDQLVFKKNETGKCVELVLVTTPMVVCEFPRIHIKRN